MAALTDRTGMATGSLPGRCLVGLFGDLVTHLLHFLVGISILQRLAEGVGHLGRVHPQPRHGAGGLHGLYGQLVVFRLIARLLVSPSLN